jgi:hypothetical protein
MEEFGQSGKAGTMHVVSTTYYMVLPLYVLCH